MRDSTIYGKYRHTVTDRHSIQERSHEEECKADILQAWAEMKHAFDNNLPLAKPVADGALLSTIKEEQAAAEQDDWREGLIEQYLNGKEKVCLIEVWQRALYPDRSPYYPEMSRRDAYFLMADVVLLSLPMLPVQRSKKHRQGIRNAHFRFMDIVKAAPCILKVAPLHGLQPPPITII